MVKYTKKMYGGDISNKDALQYILSIGYEFETDSFSKFTLYKNKLVNTDMARENISKFDENENEKNAAEIMNNADENEDIDKYLDILSIRELEIKDIKINPTIIDGNISTDFINDTLFQITNDIKETRIQRYLNKKYNVGDDKESDDEESDDEENGEENDDKKNDHDKFIEIKNSLYKFKLTDKQIIYPINFVYFIDNDYSLFSNVEWVFTYYKPKISINIIMNTFINALQNLFIHLDSLKMENGNLTITLPGTENDEIIPFPTNRILYNVPDSSVYYLQTEYYNKENLSLDDICIQPQMTFSSNIIHTINIIEILSTDTVNSISSMNELFLNKKNDIDKVKDIINKLIINYNIRARYKITKDLTKASISNYLFLILYKLFSYYNYYLQATKKNYLKSFLPFNCRHSNYELYIVLKKLLMKIYSIDSDSAIQIIIDIVCQPEILNISLIYEINYVRKGAFLKTNLLEKNNKNYGNPFYSLVSYINYFENPKTFPEDDEEKELYHDWLLFNRVDNVTNTFPIINNIVLIEFRIFNRALSIFMYDIADSELKENMKNGICNKKQKRYDEGNSTTSILNFKKFVELYNTLYSPNKIAGKKIKRKTLKKKINKKKIYKNKTYKK
jgi:hypothetical protein